MRALSRVAPTIVLTAFCGAFMYLAIENYPTAQAQIEPPLGDVAPPPTATPPNATQEPTVTVLDHHDVQGVLGKEVRSAANENMGRIVDVIVDRSGQAKAAVIDFGGFLGVGSRKIAVAWNALRFPGNTKQGDRISLELTRDQVRAAPEFKEDKPAVVLGTSGTLESLSYFPKSD
jgi:PRC-barrel domain protein